MSAILPNSCKETILIDWIKHVRKNTAFKLFAYRIFFIIFSVVIKDLRSVDEDRSEEDKDKDFRIGPRGSSRTESCIEDIIQRCPQNLTNKQVVQHCGLGRRFIHETLIQESAFKGRQYTNCKGLQRARRVPCSSRTMTSTEGKGREPEHRRTRTRT